MKAVRLGGYILGWMAVIFAPSLAAVSVISGHTGDYTAHLYQTVYLASFANTTRLSGSFMSVSENNTYTYMELRSDGSTVLRQINAQDVSGVQIYQYNGEVPRIEYWSMQTTLIPWLSCGSAIVVYLPEGSVWSGFDVDVRRP